MSIENEYAVICAAVVGLLIAWVIGKVIDS
ncbi:hypothetical protein VR7_gp278 [Escherichia phage vB_EcoM_VR7]|uniref:Uncharacterized protein VR7ORF278c n=1 Tax=Escherichia phage vB_EcoM_VR7 TaxID=700939 RepID=E5FJ42_9CAUD|nr:hypothetical protein VR7_gp278 [Escherichia phage vB_EcoM_VR7]ADR32653.1 hypothetical protein VR7_gp278 [Escherichia phage vB_EcoM_VR7]